MKSKISWAELMPLFNLVLYLFLTVILVLRSIVFSAEQAAIIQTATFSFISINIALLLFILPILSSKRRQILQTKLKVLKLSYKDTESVEKYVQESDEKMLDLTNVINMIIIETLCSFFILITSLFATIFVSESGVKSALQMAALIVQIIYFLNMILWLFYVYWKPSQLMMDKLSEMDNSVKK